jgi:hypothetical protein
MTNVEKLESLIAAGWKIPLALFLILSELLRRHPEIWVDVDDRDTRGSVKPILDIFVARERQRTIDAMYAAFADVPGVYVPTINPDPAIKNVFFEFDLEWR